MNKDYDYCDTYDSYYNGLTLDNKNEIKTFLCTRCNKSKLILKKSVDDPVFKCEECIEASSNQDRVSHEGHQGRQEIESGGGWFGFF